MVRRLGGALPYRQFVARASSGHCRSDAVRLMGTAAAPRRTPPAMTHGNAPVTASATPINRLEPSLEQDPFQKLLVASTLPDEWLEIGMCNCVRHTGCGK